MEEQKKKETEQSETKETASGNEQGGMPRRSLMLWVLAGMYLLYTGYRLCKNVIDGVEGGGIGFLLAGIAFVAVGGILLFFGAKGLLKEDKLRKEQEAAAAAEEGNAEETAEEIAEEAPKKPMSISERAGLANHLEEEESQGTEE